MDRLDAIKIFVRVVESGSFSAVARELGVGQPAVSKQVASLEAHLGAQLLMRTSRNLSLTEAGRVVINGMTDDPPAPWGGFTYSGVGREYGKYGIEAFLEPRAILGAL